MPSQYVPFKGTLDALSTQPSTGTSGVLAYTTDTQEVFADTGVGVGIPEAWKLIGGSAPGGVTQILAGTGVTVTPTSGAGIVTVNSTPTTSMPASGLTGTALPSNIVTSSLTTLAGGTVGSAAFTSSSTYDVAGAAVTAQSNAEGFATAAVAVETARAEAAETLKAPLASPVFTGSPTITSPINLSSSDTLQQMGSGLNGSNDRGVNAGVANAASIISGDAVWLKYNCYNNGTNDLFINASIAYQLVVQGGGVLVRKSTNTPTAGGAITWGTATTLFS